MCPVQTCNTGAWLDPSRSHFVLLSERFRGMCRHYCPPAPSFKLLLLVLFAPMVNVSLLLVLLLVLAVVIVVTVIVLIRL